MPRCIECGVDVPRGSPCPTCGRILPHHVLTAAGCWILLILLLIVGALAVFVLRVISLVLGLWVFIGLIVLAVFVLRPKR